MHPVATMGDILELERAGWPADLPESTYEMIQRGVAINQEAPALSFFLTAEDPCNVEVWSYGELLRRITQTANFFQTLGVGKDDVVSFILPNLPETHFTLWGGQAAGIVAAVNPFLEPSAMAAILAAVGTKVLVTLAPFPQTDLWSRLQPELAKLSTLEHLVLVNLTDRVVDANKEGVRLLQEQEVARLCGGGGLRGSVPMHIAIHDFWEGVRSQSGDRLSSGRRISSNDYSSLFCTGGTTGLPKIAMRRHGNEVANAWSAARFWGEEIGPGKTLFCGLPLFHVNAALVTGLLPFSRGAHVVLGTPQGYRGEGVVARFWEIVERHHINFFSAVPTIYGSLLQVPIAGRDISSLEYGLCGAAPMAPEIIRKFEAYTGVRILEGYGLTEATCVSAMNPPAGERRPGSIGLRLPGQMMKAAMLDDQGNYVRDCAVDEVGVLLVSGPNVFAGYRLAEHEAGLWINCGDGLRWLNTGDLGRQDSDGYFWLAGRKKDLIIRGGHNIDPAAIEEPLVHHPGVQAAAAVGRPDIHAGELPVAYVQLKAGSMATESELAEFARTAIAERAAVPKHIRIIEQLPLTAVGKIFKPALREREIQDALAVALRDAAVPVLDIIVASDPKRGVAITVKLDDRADEGKARAVLECFPFVISLQRSIQ